MDKKARIIWETAQIFTKTKDIILSCRDILKYALRKTGTEDGILWWKSDNGYACVWAANPDPSDSFVLAAAEDANSRLYKRSENGELRLLLSVYNSGVLTVGFELRGTPENTAEACGILEPALEMIAPKLDGLPDYHAAAKNQGNVILSVRDVCKSYTTKSETTQVLKGVSFDVYENEFLVIIGESGTGKTTLLNILGGLDKADSGSVICGGMDIAGAGNAELVDYRRRQVGFVFQYYSLMPNLTVLENLNYVAELVKRPLPAKDALTRLNMWEKRNSFPNHLSSGQQQRAAIARALVKNPKIILADEPTGALDLLNSIEVLDAMQKLSLTGMSTIIMITHNSEICKIADRTIYMNQGRISHIDANPFKQNARQLTW